MKRISFSELDAEHIYEWLAMYWLGERKFGGCLQCEGLGRRLVTFIGPTAKRRIERAVKKYPGNRRA